MLRHFLSALMLALTSLVGVASEASSGFTATYSLERNGIKLGEVTDVFRKSGSQYSLVSESRAAGPLKIVLSGVIHLESQGIISNNNLMPTVYRRIRSDNAKKSDKVVFDWKAGQLTLTHNNQARQAPLSAGTQDNLSQIYSFLYLPVLPDKLDVPIASGKDVDEYRYTRYPSAPLTTSAGIFDVVEYRRDAAKDEKAVSVWINKDLPHLPIRIRIIDDGVRMEQQLTSVKPGG